MNSIFRHPRTLQEMRANDDPEAYPYVRAKRRAKNLPNAWDDKVKQLKGKKPRDKDKHIEKNKGFQEE
jgi:hypothetical protein